MTLSVTKNQESEFFIKNPNLTKLEQMSRGSHIPPANATAFTPNFNVNAINIKYSKFLTFITGE